MAMYTQSQDLMESRNQRDLRHYSSNFWEYNTPFKLIQGDFIIVIWLNGNFIRYNPQCNCLFFEMIPVS